MNSKDYRNIREAYLEVYHELDEGAAGDVAARAYKLASQRKGQTPERKKMYGDLFNKASARERKPHNTDWKRQGLTQKQRDSRREIDVEYSDETGLKNSTDGPGTITKNKRKLAQQKARGQHAEQYMDEAQSYDLYDIILSHLIDEGYADTEEAAERIMVNMSEEWRESIFEEVEQLDELSVNKMLAYVEKGEKNRADLNKKWDKGTATHRERMRVLGREEGEKRASDKVEKKTGKRPYQMNALDKARYAVTKEDYMDEAQVANRDPEKYEREQAKKSAPVRGERTPMPPRGNKRREDFEKWYAANVR